MNSQFIQTLLLIRIKVKVLEEIKINFPFLDALF